MTKIILKFIFLFLLITSFVLCDNKSENIRKDIKKQNKELEKLRKDIINVEKKNKY